MDEEASWSRSVRHDSLGTDAEHSMRHFFVRCDPAAGVVLPAELREDGIETIRENGQHNLDVEVSEALLRWLRLCQGGPFSLSHSLYHIWVVTRKRVLA
jgi:hypothetical protein